MAIDPLPRSDVPAEPTEAEYRAFCDTVMATGRGRWFLAEHARRHRKATAEDALEALARIEHRLHGGRTGSTNSTHPIFEELHSLAATIRHARLDIGWSDSEFSRGAKVMALLGLLEDRIGSLLDNTDDAAASAPAIEERPEARVQLTVISANPAPVRARAELPPVDVITGATVVALPAPAPTAGIAPVTQSPPPEQASIAVAAEPPAPTLAFPTVELFEPFEIEKPGTDRTKVSTPLDFAAEPFDVADIASQAFDAPIVALARTEPEAPKPPAIDALAEAPVVKALAAANETPPAATVPQRSPGYDPMTPVRALSADERIALVS